METQPAESPSRVFSKIGVLRTSQFREPRADLRVSRFVGTEAGIPQRHAGIPDQASPLCALHRTSPEYFAKVFLGERDQPFQVR